MDKKFAFLLAIAITFLIASNYYLFKGEIESDRESVVIARVLDGDTFESADGRKFRMLNINTPEKSEKYHELASDYMDEFVNQSVDVEISGVDKYGRTLARVYTPEYVNLELVRLGFARKFLVSDMEINEFESAEENAFNNGLGLWKKSEHFGCLAVELNEKEEFLDIDSNCESEMIGWVIKDESTKKYKISKSVIDRVILYSGEGKDNEKERYWGVGNVWNNDRDSVFILDSEQDLVYYYSYGY